jgi:tetratricopeptide (TPR) repeat protein
VKWPWKRRKHQPEDLPNLLLLGDSAYRAGRRKKAIRLYRSALELDSDSLPALVNLGAIYAESPKTMGEAAVLMEKARRIDPENTSVLLNLGAILTLLGQYEKAQQTFADLEAIAPKCPDLHYNRARMHCQMRNYRDAFVETQEELRLHPNNPNALLLLEQLKPLVSGPSADA